MSEKYCLSCGIKLESSDMNDGYCTSCMNYHDSIEEKMGDVLAEEMNENLKLRTEVSGLKAKNERLREALQNISEYWNRDRNDTVMHDALWHIIEVAEEVTNEK